MTREIQVSRDGDSLGVVRFEDGDVNYEGDGLDEREVQLLEEIADLSVMQGGSGEAREAGGMGAELLTEPERYVDAGVGEQRAEVVARLRSMGYEPEEPEV